MIRVLVVDDHAVVRAGLAALIDTTRDLSMVGEAADGAEAVALARKVRPDVILMDLSMPGVDGVDAIAELVADNPSTHLLVLTSFSDRTRILGALRAGAEGYLLKQSEPEVLLDGIREVANGGTPLDPKATRVLLSSLRSASRGDDATLTNREREVLERVGDGQTNKAIALDLGISERTVKAHLTSIFHRIGVTDRIQAALWARRHLSPPDST